MSSNGNANYIEYLLRFSDDRLILGHRLSQLCGHGPYLEEDIASTNTALDLIGQASAVYQHIAALEGKTEDDYAYLRDERQFRNLLLVEQSAPDFAYVMFRQFLFDSFTKFYLAELSKSSDDFLSAIAQKCAKENNYHLRRSSNWIIRFGAGTAESKRRLLRAIEDLWIYAGEMFKPDHVDKALAQQGIAPELQSLMPAWQAFLQDVFERAELPAPDFEAFFLDGGRKGVHTEHLGHLLAEMQSLHRTYPEIEW